MKNTVGKYLCGAGVIMLASSDAYTNLAASVILGSSNNSQNGIKFIAVGVVVGLMAMGSLASIVKSGPFKLFLWSIVGVASVFSAVLTIQAVSVDYAANDHGGTIQNERQYANDKKIKQYEREIDSLEKKIKECERDRYFKPCESAQRRIATLSTLIASASDDSLKAELAKQVDITDAVEEKAGISGQLVERVGIYARALFTPLMMSVLMFGFWEFWGLCRAEKKRKKKLAETGSGTNETESGTISENRTNLVVKRTGKHTKNRTRLRTLMHEHKTATGHYPTYAEAISKFRKLYGRGVGRSLVSEVLAEIKAGRAA